MVFRSGSESVARRGLGCCRRLRRPRRVTGAGGNGDDTVRFRDRTNQDDVVNDLLANLRRLAPVSVWLVRARRRFNVATDRRQKQIRKKSLQAVKKQDTSSYEGNCLPIVFWPGVSLNDPPARPARLLRDFCPTDYAGNDGNPVQCLVVFSRPMTSQCSARCIAVAALLSAIIAGSAGAQGRGSIPIPALPDQPWEYQTANAKIRVRVLTAGLENPWSLEFLPDASILITERNGRLRHFKDGKLSGPVPGLPAVVADNFISGLHDIKLHPDFAKNRLVYWVYNKGDAAAAAGAGGGRGGAAAGAGGGAPGAGGGRGGAAAAAGGGAAGAGGGRGAAAAGAGGGAAGAAGGRGAAAAGAGGGATGAGGGRAGGGGGARALTVARGVFDGTALTKVEDVIRMQGASTVSRMSFVSGTPVTSSNNCCATT